MIEQAPSVGEIARTLHEVNHQHAGEFAAAKRIADLAHTHTTGEWWQDWRRHRPNPFFGQTEHGLIVIRGRGANQVFDTLMTPWGEWHTMGSRSGVVFDSERFLTDAELEQMETPPRDSVSFVAHLGEYFRVTSVGDLNLPSASLRERRHGYVQTGRAWADLETRYNSLVPQERARPRTRR